MPGSVQNNDLVLSSKPLLEDFNKGKFNHVYSLVKNPAVLEIQNLSKKQCMNKDAWPVIDKINAWMISAETATFMKCGGLGMIASELPEAFNSCFADNAERLSVVTPMYLGDTKKKKAYLDGDVYHGSEKQSVKLKKVKTIAVPFYGARSTLVKHKVDVYQGRVLNTDYIFLANERFFSINPHSGNPSSQGGCYIHNKYGINEVERFAFFSKAVYCLLRSACDNKKGISAPNMLVANDWHSGALAGLTKYLTTALQETGDICQELAIKIKDIPVVHIAHHLGYQGWDYDNTSRILNSLYEDFSSVIFKNAKAVKNSNERVNNALIVHDCYNQASCNFHLADRVVTVSKNYAEEVSSELGFGFDFRSILKIRKDHRNFFGIVNGYDKKLISPNAKKIEHINDYFGEFDFKVFDEKSLDKKIHNKKEFIKLISKISTDSEYKNKVIPLIDIYKFEDISNLLDKAKDIPILCATSRLVEQKGYDVAAHSIVNLAKTKVNFKHEYPIVVLGGAGDREYFSVLTKLKDKVAEINKEVAKRIFVFRGYRDEFAYAVQLASDFYMMPCRFEPCGLTQMEAMAKGAIPIAMSTGGLVDTIDDGVDGFRTDVFFVGKRRVYGNNITAKRIKTNVNAYTETLAKSLLVFYANYEKISVMQYNAMAKDFSWNVPEVGSVYKYYKLFKTGNL